MKFEYASAIIENEVDPCCSECSAGHLEFEIVLRSQNGISSLIQDAFQNILNSITLENLGNG